MILFIIVFAFPQRVNSFLNLTPIQEPKRMSGMDDSLLFCCICFKPSLIISPLILNKMDPLLHLPMRIRIVRISPKHLQMIQNRTPPPAILLRKLDRTRRPQKSAGRHALQLRRPIPHPILARLAKVSPALAHNRPIVSGVALPPLAEAGDLVLIAEGTADAVRVEVGTGVEVHEADDLAAFDGGADFAVGVVVSFSELPEAFCGAHVFDGCYELLSAARLELSLITREVKLATRFHVSHLDGGSASDIFLVVVVCGSRRKGGEGNCGGKEGSHCWLGSIFGRRAGRWEG